MSDARLDLSWGQTSLVAWASLAPHTGKRKLTPDELNPRLKTQKKTPVMVLTPDESMAALKRAFGGMCPDVTGVARFP